MESVKAKRIVSKQRFRDLVIQGVGILSEPVVATLGPEGLPILIQRDGAPPFFTKDGVTVARHTKVKNPLLDTIITSLKESSEKTNEKVGDGTTTAVALSAAIIREGMKQIKSGIVTPQELVNGIRKLGDLFPAVLEKWVRKIKTKEEQHNVAYISANNDKVIADKVVEAVEMAGEDGYVSLEDGTSKEIKVQFVEGYTLSSGWSNIGAYGTTFVNNSQKNSVDILKPAILLYDGVVSDVNDLANFYIALTNNGTRPIPLLIIAHNFEGEALNMLILNKRAGQIVGLAKVPYLSTISSRRWLLDDLAALTGGKVVEHDSNGIMKGVFSGEKVKTLNEGVLGCCDKVVIGKKDTIIYGGHSDDEEKIKYSDTLRGQLPDAESESEFDVDLIKTRLSKMFGGIVEIQVGGSTELEVREKKYRVEDALNATRAATEMGVVPGGGIVFFNLAEIFLKDYLRDNVHMAIAIKVMKEALKDPLRIILSNADIKPDEIIGDLLKTVRSHPLRGYDAKKKVLVENMMDAGIMDPLKVSILALRSAISISCELLCGGGMLAFDEGTDNPSQSDFYVNESNQEV